MSTLLGGYKHHKARKQHRCWLCGKPIMPGEMYMASFVVDGGDTSYDREHVHCHNIMHDQCQGCKDYDGECWRQDCFDEAIEEHACKKCGAWPGCKDNPYACGEAWEIIKKNNGEIKKDER